MNFDAIWDDKTFGGTLNNFKVNYYLANDTVEVVEIHVPNSGKSPFPLLLKRCHLPKEIELSHCPGMLKNNENVYTAKDFILG